MRTSENAPSTHSSVSITLDVYSHVIPGLGDTAATAMDEALCYATDDQKCPWLRHPRVLVTC